MKKRSVVFISVLLAILMAACGGSQQQAEGGRMPEEALDTIWEWQELTVLDPKAQYAIAEPQSYTLFFSSDGFSDVEADCNFIQGKYEVVGKGLQFSVGAPSYNICAPNSASCTYLILLGQVDGYRLEDGKLVLPFGDGAGELVFAKVGAPVQKPPSSSNIIGGPGNPGSPSGPSSPGSPGAPGDSGGKKVVVCHKAKSKNPVTIEISVNALDAHLAHGDVQGPCK